MGHPFSVPLPCRTHGTFFRNVPKKQARESILVCRGTPLHPVITRLQRSLRTTHLDAVLSGYMARDVQREGSRRTFRRLISNLLPADAHLLALVILSSCFFRYRWCAALEPGRSSIGCRCIASVANRCSVVGLGIVSQRRRSRRAAWHRCWHQR